MKTKKDYFPVILAIIGFLADIIGISTFIITYKSMGEGDRNLSFLTLTITIFILIYGWFTVCWYLIKRYFENKEFSRNRDFIILLTTLGVGLCLIPISVLIDIATDWEFMFTVIHLFVYNIAIFFSIKFLFPVIFPEYSILGNYECEKEFKTAEGDVLFELEDRIEVYSKRDSETSDGEIVYLCKSTKNSNVQLRNSELLMHFFRRRYL